MPQNCWDRRFRSLSWIIRWLATARLGEAAEVLRAIAAASIEMSDLIGLGRLYGQLGASRASTNTDGDVQKELDVLANDVFIDAFRRAPVAAVVSEELSEPLVLDPAAPLAVAMDPLDGSSNIDANVSIGTIFSIVPVLADANGAEAHFLQPGRTQIAAGFVIYGPQTSLVFALGSGQTQIFTLDRRDGRFYQAMSAPVDRQGVRRIRDQCLELQTLGRSGPGLHRRLRARRGRAAEAQPQHALDRFACRRRLPDLAARAGFSFIPAISAPVIAMDGCGSFTRPIRLPLSSNARGVWRATACVPFSTSFLRPFMPGCPLVFGSSGHGRARRPLSQRSAIFRRARAIIRQARPHAALELRNSPMIRRG